MSAARWAIGTAVLGRPAYLNTGSSLPPGRTREALQDNMCAVLDAATSAGVAWVDTARSYGDAEAFVAHWLALRAGRPGFVAPTVSSKWGYRYVGGWRTDADVHEVKEHTLPRFRQQWQHSRELLGERIGLYQVHSLTPDSPLLADTALLAELAALREIGVAVGFSTSGPQQAETVRAACRISVDGTSLFSAVQSTWNVRETSVGPALQEAADSGMTVLVKEALANGLLATDPPAALADVAAAHGSTPDAVALAVVAAQPFVSRVLIGASTVDQLRSNLTAGDLALTTDELASLTAAPDEPAVYWDRRSQLPWH